MTVVSTWTAERSAQLKKLWEAGLSCSQIAAEMGYLTRNAVIGRVHRMGLEGRARVERQPPKPRVFTYKPRARTPKLKIYSETNRVHFSVDAEQPLLRCVEVIPLNIGLMALTDQTCRFPYNEGAAIVFCGHASLGETYCYLHAELCRGARTPQRNEIRRGPKIHARFGNFLTSFEAAQ